MTKEKTAKLIPNAIQISTDNEKVRPKLEDQFSHYLLESWVKFHSPQNISGAKQLHSFLLNNWSSRCIKKYNIKNVFW